VLSAGTTIALTGTTGFIGGALVAALRERGCRVRALLRDPARAPSLSEMGCEVIAGDLDSAGALRDLVQGVDRVVHCAGAVRGGRYAHFHRANVNGSLNLFETLAATGSSAPLLFFSSLAAREPGLSWYGRSKFAAEQALAQSAPACVPFPWTVLRPPAVYGPGDRELLPLFRTMARRGFAPLPGSTEARVSLVHIDDLVSATLALLDCEAAQGETLSLHDGRDGGYNWTDIAAAAERAWGRPVQLRPVPPRLLNLAAAANLRLSRLSGRAPMLTPAKLRELRHPDWVCDNDTISRLCAWQPRVSLLEGLVGLTDAVA
jgi:nucleoside-diphosphate-sugar epimerase